MNQSVHTPVMLTEMLTAMAPRDGETYVDATFGAGGYSRALLEAAACRVFAIDRDPRAVERGKELAALFPDRLRLLLGRFGDLATLLRDEGVKAVDGVAMDVGVSSPQLDDPARGFSFRADGPLDMRMGGDGPTAADLVNEYSEQELARILREFGEERQARAVARRIVAARALAPVTGTGQLAEIIRGVVRPSRDRVDPATRSFQALRIVVNDELGELRRGLHGAEDMLRPGGRLVVVSFHSLEDRIVKNFLNSRAGRRSAPSRHAPPTAAAGPEPSFELLSRKALKPDPRECAGNPRARSARLRAARRTDAPVFPEREAA